MNKVPVCQFDDLTEGSSRRFEVDGRQVALVRIDDDVFALGDRCSHANVSLSEGEVDSDAKTIECWKHGSSFSMTSGEPDSLPATKPVPVYEVLIEDGAVFVVVSERSAK